MADFTILRKYLKHFGLLFVAVIIVFLACKLYSTWNEIPFAQIRINYFWLLASGLNLLGSFVCIIAAWQKILNSLRHRLSFGKSWWVVTGSFLAKYVPGNIWVIGGRMYLCKREGIPEKISGTGVILEMVAVLLGVLLVFMISMPFLVSHGLPAWIWYLLVPIPFSAVLFFSPILPRVLKWMAARFLRKELDLTFGNKDLVKALGFYILSSLLQGVALFFIIRSIYPLGYENIPDVIGIFNGSWAVGFLSFITPAGLGVREGVLTMFLSRYLPLPMAIIIAAVNRLWLTLFEIAMALVGLKFIKKERIVREEKES
jgi:uncharacterized membrane protein YbhN (UPF0104 family)